MAVNKPLRLFCSGSAGMIELKRINHFEIIIFIIFKALERVF